MKGRLNGLDLFSGIGGNTLALREYIKTTIYCERDRYAQSVLLSRMASNDIESAPIWDDVTTLTKRIIQEAGLGDVDIIMGGFPCQDISTAGNGKGLGGERSSLFYEIIRLAKEIKPTFVFLENVPAIRTRGLETVVQELTKIGYDCRWTMLSAASVGAQHKRERWFLLACRNRYVPDVDIVRVEGERTEFKAAGFDQFLEDDGQPIEPTLVRGFHGIPQRVDRIKCLGNAVVPLQAKTAFEYLIGGKI